MDKVSQEYLWDRFHYKEGKLIWKPHTKLGKTSNHFSGKEAGTLGERGYIVVKLDGKAYPISRLIFCMFYGYMPEEVDHEDRDKLNNNYTNLRASDRSSNCSNRKVSKANLLGIKNIRERNNKFQVRVTKNGKTVTRTEATLEKAIETRDKLLVELQGEFANLEV